MLPSWKLLRARGGKCTITMGSGHFPLFRGCSLFRREATPYNSLHILSRPRLLRRGRKPPQLYFLKDNYNTIET